MIVLVDAGEAMGTPARHAALVRMRTSLVDALTGRRPLDGLPALTPADLLTVHHFGIGRPGTSVKLNRLDVRRDFLRTKLHHVRGASAEQIVAALKPGAFYAVAPLAWARPLALADAKVTPSTPIQRTILVLLTTPDCLRESPGASYGSLSQSDRKNLGLVREKVATQYRFAGRDRREGELLSVSSPSLRGGKPVSLAAYEVVSIPADRQAQALAAKGIRDFSISDPWLGTARVRTGLSVAPDVSRGGNGFLAAAFLVLGGILALAAALAGVAWLVYQIRVARHFRIRMPGHGSWMSLPNPSASAQTLAETTSHAALPRGEALRIRLPHPWLRRWLYRDATLNLQSEGGKARWQGIDGTEAPISAFGREAVATWEDVAAYGVQAAVTIQRGSAATGARIEYPRLKVARLETHRTMKYHVALDLGSDSMAAYFASDRESRMVPLQEFAPLTVTNRRPDFLRTPDANGEMKVSSRLRSRIVLSSNQTDPQLAESHATLDFWDASQAEPILLDGYRQSIFDFWQPELTPPLMNTTLPNPKVMFQYGVEDAFPAARTLSGEAMNLTPEAVVGHLTVQVLRNLVLRSGPLKRIDPKEIEVILTVPNVYSVEHAENLRETVERLAGVGRVSTISESDALAYYFLAERRPAVRVHSDEAEEKGAPSPVTQILTIDVGRGTTDLSLIQTQQVEGEERVWVRARTGRSSGGGELTYLFVQFYEREIRRVFREHGDLLAFHSEALSREQKEPPMSFLWLKNRALADADPMYGKAFYAMAELVEETKRAFGEHYLFNTPASAQPHIQTIVDALMRFTEYAFIDVPGWKDGKAAEIEEFRHHLTEALTVNAQLGTGRSSALALGNGRSIKGEMGGWWQRTVAGMRGSRRIAVAEPPTVRALPENDRTNLDWLARQIRDYVRKNVHHLLVELGTMVANQEDRKEFAAAESLDERVEIALRALVEPGRTHVVVGGQASQFGPLKRAIHALFRPMQGEELASLTVLVGQDAKDACCQGAVIYATSGHQPQNRDALHGSYGFVDIARTEGAAVFPVDPRRLNDDGETRVTTPTDVARYLVFTPGTFGGSGEEVDEAMLSRLGRFRGREYCVTYRREEGDPIRRLRVDGEEVRLSTFGDLKDNIWKKVWPDQLPREPQS